jgi:hypothetical protein
MLRQPTRLSRPSPVALTAAPVALAGAPVALAAAPVALAAAPVALAAAPVALAVAWIALAAPGCGTRASPGLPGDAGTGADGADGADGGDAGRPLWCAADDARADGSCDTVLDGFRWDGASCVALGTGCSCAGSDCGRLATSLEECVRRHRVCYAQGCAPQTVRETFCAQCGAERIRAFWDGIDCFEMDVCTCDGEGCAESFGSVAECLTVMAQCDSSLCGSTGGLYYPATPCGPCGDYVCGESAGKDCCTSGCDCGPGRSFMPGVGCRVDPACIDRQLCRASGGTWHPADSGCSSCGDFVCGQPPSGQDCCVTGCDCGPHRSFVAGQGCHVDSTCHATQEQKCAATGGTVDPTCSSYQCGELVATDTCDSSGCNCGPQRNWDEAAGCVVAAECLTRQVGQSCTGWEGSSNCRPGLVCCVQCSATTGCVTCQMPEPCCQAGDPGCTAACPAPRP